MAITTYSELQTAITGWTKRSDTATLSKIPDFIALGEADINTDLDVRTVETDQTLTLTAGLSTVALPTGFREALNLWPEWTSGRGAPLRMIMPELQITRTIAGLPTTWCVKGSTIAFDCPADQTYTYTLRQRGGIALSDASPTNLILTNYPNLYLAAALKEAGVFMEDAEFSAIWQGKYETALAKARQKEGRDKGRVTLSTGPGELTFYGRRDGFNVNRGY